MAGRERDPEVLAEEVAALEPGGLAARDGRVLEGDPEMQLARPYPRRQVVGALVDRHLGPPIAVIERRDGYYVLDGRHRVSVARTLGQREIDAWTSAAATPRQPARPPLSSSRS